MFPCCGGFHVGKTLTTWPVASRCWLSLWPLSDTLKQQQQTGQLGLSLQQLEVGNVRDCPCYFDIKKVRERPEGSHRAPMSQLKL